jgi:sulfur-oxidizing protein SoxB
MAYTSMMTGSAIKAMMEDVCDNLFNPDPYYQQGGDMIRVGGMNYACAPAKLIGHRISDMVLDNGKPIEANKSYKTVSWASVSLPQNGKPIWDVVADNLRRQKVVKVAKPNQVKLVGIGNNPGYEA